MFHFFPRKIPKINASAPNSNTSKTRIGAKNIKDGLNNMDRAPPIMRNATNSPLS